MLRAYTVTRRPSALGHPMAGVPYSAVSHPNGASDPTDNGLPIRLLHDRILVQLEGAEGERRSAAGIVIPATASVGKRLSWATVAGVGPHVRMVVSGDRVLFDPDE